jgi:hypothetical protein
MAKAQQRTVEPQIDKLTQWSTVFLDGSVWTRFFSFNTGTTRGWGGGSCEQDNEFSVFRKILGNSWLTEKLLKNFTEFYGTLKFIPVFTRAWARWNLPSFFFRHILILSSNLRLSISSYFFPSRFSRVNFYEFLFSSLSATCPANIILLTFTVQEYLAKSTIYM